MKKRTVFICQGTGCLSSGSKEVYDSLCSEILRLVIKDVDIDFTGCHGFCEQGPIVIVEPEGIFYTRVQAEDSVEIAGLHLKEGFPVDRLFYRDPASGQAVPLFRDVNFYSKQQ